MPKSSAGMDWNERDGDHELALPYVTPVSRRDRWLTPTPPDGWRKVFVYCSRPPVIVTDTAAWIYCLAHVHEWEGSNDLKGMHMICRDRSGARVLVVHPDLDPVVEDTIASLNGVLTQCSCGGYDCLEPTLQERAARVFARRACEGIDVQRLQHILEQLDFSPQLARWAEMSTGQRIEFVDQAGFPLSSVHARDWISVINSDHSSMSGELEAIAHNAIFPDDDEAPRPHKRSGLLEMLET